MAQTVNAQTFYDYLRQRTTDQLCDDFVVLSQGEADWEKFARTAIGRVLSERNEVAWIEWMLEGTLFGAPAPHRFFMPK